MITDQQWHDFMEQFFGVDPRWTKHVVTNWNHVSNEPGCPCRFNFIPTAEDDYGPRACVEYKRLIGAPNDAI